MNLKLKVGSWDYKILWNKNLSLSFSCHLNLKRGGCIWLLNLSYLWNMHCTSSHVKQSFFAWQSVCSTERCGSLVLQPTNSLTVGSSVLQAYQSSDSWSSFVSWQEESKDAEYCKLRTTILYIFWSISIAFCAIKQIFVLGVYSTPSSRYYASCTAVPSVHGIVWHCQTKFLPWVLPPSSDF